MELDGRGFPSSDLSSDAFLIGKKILKAQALKLPGRDLQTNVSVSLSISSQGN